MSVTNAGRPVAGAHLAIYAVDDSILTLGGWTLPHTLVHFFPARVFVIVTYSALKADVDKIAPSCLSMKGFVAGDAGAEEFGKSPSHEKNSSRLSSGSGVCEPMPRGLLNLYAKRRIIYMFPGYPQSVKRGKTSSVRRRNLYCSKRLIIEPRFRGSCEMAMRSNRGLWRREKASDSEQLLVRCMNGGALD